MWVLSSYLSMLLSHSKHLKVSHFLLEPSLTTSASASFPIYIAFDAKPGPISATAFNRNGSIFAYAGGSLFFCFTKSFLFVSWEPLELTIVSLPVTHSPLSSPLLIGPNPLCSSSLSQSLTIGVKDTLLLVLNSQTKSSCIQLKMKKLRRDQRSRGSEKEGEERAVTNASTRRWEKNLEERSLGDRKGEGVRKGCPRLFLFWRLMIPQIQMY